MTVFELSQEFSKQLKIAKLDYVYNATVTVKTFNHFLEAFQRVNLKSLITDHEKKVFWINVYNGSTNYFIIKQGLKNNMKEHPRFFKDLYINIGGIDFSLDDIEHGLLRKNARLHLPDNDKKLQYQVNNLDYRIHFALNCGAISCPAIANYSLKAIEEELKMAESIFAEHEFFVNQDEKTIECSEIFIWYQDDFKESYLNNLAYENYTIIKKPYNWQL